MATKKQKLELQEDLSNAFITTNAKTYAKDYQKHLNAIQLLTIERVEKGLKLTQKTLSKGIKVTGVNINTRNAYILGSVGLLIQHDRNRQLKRKLRPMVDLMALYSIRNPKQFAAKVDKLVKHSMGFKVTLNTREIKALDSIDTFMRQNREEVQRLVNTNTKALKAINQKITTNQSRIIIKRRKALIRERITVNGVKRRLTNDEIASRLRSEFKNDSARLNRILETETHRQNELTKSATAKAQGFTKKTWNNRGANVRKGHQEVDRKTISINDEFKVWRYKSKNGALVRNGFDMMDHPGDSTASADNVINCKCFLVFN